jgi:hypothetical protein
VGERVADGDVVEAVAGLVGRAGGKRRRCRGRERSRDGVAIFGAIETAEGIGAAGILGGGVEPGFQSTDERFVAGFVCRHTSSVPLAVKVKRF